MNERKRFVRARSRSLGPDLARVIRSESRFPHFLPIRDLFPGRRIESSARDLRGILPEAN